MARFIKGAAYIVKAVDHQTWTGKDSPVRFIDMIGVFADERKHRGIPLYQFLTLWEKSVSGAIVIDDTAEWTEVVGPAIVEIKRLR